MNLDKWLLNSTDFDENSKQMMKTIHESKLPAIYSKTSNKNEDLFYNTKKNIKSEKRIKKINTYTTDWINLGKPNS